MRILSLLIVLAFASSARAAMPAGLKDAIAARSLLGADTWCRLVRIENTAPRGLFNRRDYPPVVYAAVFELSGILWFYTATDGTQSLSLTTRTVRADEASPGRLFLKVYPGFTRWSWVEGPVSVPSGGPRTLANGCFVESISCLLARMASGQEVVSPRLLSYYVDTRVGVLGHTVLLFGTHRGLAVVDPEVSPRPLAIPAEVGDNPMALSAYIRGSRVSAARTLPLACGRDWPALLAQESAAGPGTG
jgi:hypothetical protein